MYDTQPSTLPTTGQETQLQAKQAAEETCTEQILEQWKEKRSLTKANIKPGAPWLIQKRHHIILIHLLL